MVGWAKGGRWVGGIPPVELKNIEEPFRPSKMLIPLLSCSNCAFSFLGRL